jgi:NTE family protein
MESTSLEQQAVGGLGADLVLEGGGVKGIALAGAIVRMSEAGYVFPRVAGTSAGAIVASLVAAYQAAGMGLERLATDMRELDYASCRQPDTAEKVLGPVGEAYSVLRYQGLYESGFVRDWLSAKLAAASVSTFADLKITDDEGTSLAPQQRYRLVVNTSDLTRKVLTRLPWDLPYYLLRTQGSAAMAEQLAAIDRYSVVDAVIASMSIPYYFRPFQQKTPFGMCTWVDGGLLQNFPVTEFDRTDGKPNRWPTFGVKLMAWPTAGAPDKRVRGDLREATTIVRTALGEWNLYLLDDEGVANRTIYVDTSAVPSLEFALSDVQRDELYESGVQAANAFLEKWDAGQAQPA